MLPDDPQAVSAYSTATIAACVIDPDRRDVMSLLRRVPGFVFRLASELFSRDGAKEAKKNRDVCAVPIAFALHRGIAPSREKSWISIAAPAVATLTDKTVLAMPRSRDEDLDG